MWSNRCCLLCAMVFAAVSLGAAEFTSLDIGTATGGSTTPVGADGFEMRGSGDNIFGASDGFRFMYRQVSGDFDVRARLMSVQNTDDWAKAGIMVRQAAAPGSAHATVLAHANSKAQFRHRSAAAAPSHDSKKMAIPTTFPNTWLRLARSGAKLTGYLATDERGAKWETLGVVEIHLKDPVLVGLCVCSNASSTLCLASFRSVSISGGTSEQAGSAAEAPKSEHRGGASGNAAPRPSSEWVSQDVSARAGKTNPVGQDGFDVSGSGKDIWDTSDGFRFVYQRVSGDCEIRARVASLQKTDDWAKAGVMVRQSTAPGSIHTMLSATVQNGCVFQRRIEGGGEMTGDACGATNPGNTWVRLVRSGKAITAYVTTDEEGKQWRRVGAESLDLNDPVLVGLCVSSHNVDVLCTAGFRNVSLLTEAATPNDPVAAAAAAGAAGEAKPQYPGLSMLDSSAAKPPAPQSAAPQPAAGGSEPAARASSGEAKPADRSLAAALASSAAKLAAQGKVDKARDLCFRALANDEDCAEALYELGKIFEKDGRLIAAGDFLARAARQLAKDEGANPAFTSKRLDAERRVKALNPYAARFNEVLTDYALALSLIVKKVPDTLTQEEALDRIGALRLPDFVPPDKLPAIDRPKPSAGSKTVTSVDEDGFVRRVTKNVVTSVPPDVERTLKGAGWTTISGIWKKKGENVYEVTDGKLETPKTNGALQVIVHKGGTGKVRVMVRNNQRPSGTYYYSYSYSSTGYGFQVEGEVAKMYSASGGYFYSTSSGIYRPYLERDVPLPGPKNKILIQIAEGKLEMLVNDKREHNSNYKLGKDGPFAIEIDGTATIESPQAMGQ